MPKISFWISEGALFSSVTTLTDTFAIANLWQRALEEEETGPLFQTEILTTDGAPVTALGNIPVMPHGAVDDEASTDCLIVAPTLPNVTPMPANLDRLGRWISALRRREAPIATICTGTFVLAELGLLDGKTATGAATAVYQLALHLIRRFGSNRLASACCKALLVDPNRNSQIPYVLTRPLRNHGDAQVLKAQRLIAENYAAIDSVDAIAREVGISPRHFKRRFKSATGDLPLKYLQRIRIDAAKERLETTNQTIEEITWAVGYQDVSSFCRLFKQHAAISPSVYREKFCVHAEKMTA
jgi:transcriptional regulator GlxA family with amidase domain